MGKNYYSEENYDDGFSNTVDAVLRTSKKFLMIGINAGTS